MCGRGACTLEPGTLCRACEYKDSNGKHKTLSWTKSEIEYKPSPNIGPRDALPCVVAGTHFGSNEERVLCAMMWGMIPPWHEGNYKKHTMSTHNARLENIEKSKLYAPPLRRGQRCLVVLEGYYEWKAGKTKKEPKQPYYIYSTQENGIRADDNTTWKDEWSKEIGWKGFKVLYMAGIFNTFKTAEGKIIYSCSIITRNSYDALSWLHDRTPVFLQTEEDKQAWLDKDIAMTEAVERLNELTLLKGSLTWHPVSTIVNNVLCKSNECTKEIKIKEEKKSSSTGFMASWLKKGSTDSAKRKSTENKEKPERNDSDEDRKPLKLPKLE